MTLSLDPKERHQQYTDKGHGRGKPEYRSIWLVRIMGVVATRRWLFRNTREDCGGGAKAESNGKLDGRLKYRTGYGLLVLGQRGHDIHLR